MARRRKGSAGGDVRRLWGLLRSSLFLLPAIFVFTGVTIVSPLSEQARPKRVLIISTGSRLAPGFIAVDQQLLKALGKVSDTPIEVYAENLDIVRFPTEDAQRVFSEYLTSKYANHPADLVVLVFVGNLEIPGKLLPGIFPRTPIVVAGLTEEPLRVDEFGPFVTGVAQRVNPRATFEIIRRLQPETRRIVVIGGTAEIDRGVLNRVREGARGLEGQVDIEFWDNGSMAELRRGVSALPPQTVVLFARLFRDSEGQSLISTEVGKTIAEWANAPVYVMVDSILGTGAVGGSIASIENVANRAGELARNILTGKATPSSIEISAETTPMFDARALKRWGIPENRLPPKSIVRYRRQSLWNVYGGYILMGVLVIGIQMAIIVDLLVLRRRRFRMQAELEESREMIELAATAGELGLWARDINSGTIWVNDTLRSMFGLGKNETLRMHDVLAYVHPDDRVRVSAEAQIAEERDLPFEEEFRVLLPDSKVRWILTKGRPVRTYRTDGRRRMGVMLDITELKDAEEALRESEERFRTMADTAPVMIWMSATDKLFTFFNKGWLAFRGRTLEQELGKGRNEGIHPDDFDGYLQTYTDAFNSRKRFMMDYRLRRFDGEYRWVLDTGAPRFAADGKFLGYIGSAVDVTERKRSAQDLEKERAFLRQVIDIDPNFIFAKDRQGRFTLANQAVADAYGTTVEDLIGKTDAHFNPNRAEVEYFRQIDFKVIDTSHEHFVPEECITDARGNIRWLQTVKRPIFESDGSVRQVLGSSTDITRRKSTEAQLREQRAELAHVGRISHMGELAASLAHELNQPLTAILSNAQAAMRFIDGKAPNIDEVRDILRDIVNDNSRAADVIRRMRALVKKEAVEFAPLDLGSLIRDVVTLVHSDAILQDVGIAVNVGDDLPPVIGDRVELQQVALNLLLNAFDAMKDCAFTDRKVSIITQFEDGGRMIQVAVRDGGIGLTPEKLDKMFQPFYTTKHEGLGMGLSICRTIVEAHHGRLWAESNADGRGATFYFTIPVQETSGGDLRRTDKL